MKNLLVIIFLLFTYLGNTQTTKLPEPKDGMDNFVNNLQNKISYPFNYYENEGFTIQVMIDSVAKVKLTELNPYNSKVFKEVKAYVESTEWSTAIQNGLPKTEMLLVSVKLNNDLIKDIQKAYPKEGLLAFQKNFVQYIGTTYYRNFKYLQYKVEFAVDEKGKINISNITPADSSFQFEVKRYLEKKNRFVATSNDWQSTCKVNFYVTYKNTVLKNLFIFRIKK